MEGRNVCVFCPQMYLQALEKCPAHGRSSVKYRMEAWTKEGETRDLRVSASTLSRFPLTAPSPPVLPPLKPSIQRADPPYTAPDTGGRSREQPDPKWGNQKSVPSPRTWSWDPERSPALGPRQ